MASKELYCQEEISPGTVLSKSLVRVDTEGDSRARHAAQHCVKQVCMRPWLYPQHYKETRKISLEHTWENINFYISILCLYHAYQCILME